MSRKANVDCPYLALKVWIVGTNLREMQSCIWNSSGFICIIYIPAWFESGWEAPKVVSVGISICNGGTENDTVNSLLNLAFSRTNVL